MRSIGSYSLQFLLIACVSIGALFIAHQLWVEYPRDLAAVEAHQQREIDSLSQGLAQSQSQLQAVVRDWAHWDATFNFIQRPDEHSEYVKGNVVPGTFELFNLVGIGYYDRTLKPVLLRGYDQQKEGWAPFEDALALPLEALFADDLATQPEQSSSGWLMTHQGPAEFAVDYVTTSEGDQPVGGYLVFIRLISSAQLEALQSITRLGLELEPASSQTPGLADIPQLKLEPDALKEGFQQQRRRILADPSGTPVAILTLSHDPIANPVRIGRVEILMLLALILVPVVVMAFVDRLLLRPLRQNAARIEEMVRLQALEPLPQQFPVRELEQLRHAFNRSVNLVQAQQEQLTALSHTDALTGIPNRRAFDQSADIVWRQARRSQQPFMLALVDLDYFKPFNDQLGHPAGDEALRQLAQTLAGFARRSGDFCARLGGEEFAAVILGLSEGDARQWAEELRVTIENLAITHPGSSVAPVLTASIGAFFVARPEGPDPGMALSELLSLADKALYRAKHAGRNRVHFEVLPSQEDTPG